MQQRHKKKFLNKNNYKFRKIIKFVNNSSKVGDTNDLFKLCNYLFSKENTFINGQEILLDGGSNSVNPDPVALLLNYEKI